MDDEPLTRRHLAELLRGEGFTADTASSLAEGARKLEQGHPQLLLLDLMLPDGPGLSLCENLEAGSATEIVVITGHASVETAVEALQRGASDYLTKPIDESRLKAILKNVTRIRGLRNEIGDLQDRLRRVTGCGPLIHDSPAMQTVEMRVRQVAPTDTTVLVHGESGSGKEVVCQMIHDLSPRRTGPFLAINCGAISPTLIESELFGHEPGSFTGAGALHRGSFERAHGGTLFLDEIGDMPVELQVKLLRVLETGTLMRVGGVEELEVDVRILAATNQNPLEAVENGKLRADLYYRLNVFSIEIPPLRKRPEDIELLAAHFLSELNQDATTGKRLTPTVLALLRKYAWPGNVRQLRNVVHRAFIVAEDEIRPEHLPGELTEPSAQNAASPRLAFEVGTPISEVERRMILATMKLHGGNKTQTAKVLGINLRTLYNRLHSYESEEETE